MSLLAMLLWFVGLQLIWTLVLRTFPDLLGGALLKRLEHRQNLKLEETKSDLHRRATTDIERAKTELQATYSTLKTSVDFLSAGQSELREKVISSIELLWEGMLACKEEFNGVLFVTGVLLPKEIDQAIRGENKQTLLQGILTYRDQSYLASQLQRIGEIASEKTRLFAGDRLWLIYYVTRAMLGRTAYLIHQSFVEERYIAWQDDSGVYSLLSAVLPTDTVSAAKVQTLQGLQVLVGHLEAEFLKQAAKVMSGSESFAKSLSDIQATLLLETKLLAQQSGQPQT